MQDSDLYPFGYRFKPWTGPPIATAEQIRKYMSEVIEETRIGDHIRYEHRVASASWSSEDRLWTVEVTRTDTDEQLRFTTATLVPAVAEACEHVTVLQRSPTYFFPGRNVNELADTLRELDIPEEWTREIVRRKILQDQEALTRLSVEAPDLVREELLKGVRELLPEGYDVDTHFGPQYRPWQQRLAFVPDGDLFAGIRPARRPW